MYLSFLQFFKQQTIINLFQKFLINLFITLEESDKLSVIDFNCPDFPLDTEKFPIIGKFFDDILLYKNNFVTSLKLNFAFRKVLCLYYIITINIQELTIGDLDTQTFASFTQYMKKESEVMESNGWPKGLKYLKIVISKKDFNISYGYQYLRQFFSIKKPQKLKELIFDSSILLNDFQVCEILDIINYDTIQNYSLIFSSIKKSISEIINLDDNIIYFTEKDEELMSTLVKCFSLKGVKLMKNRHYYIPTIKLIAKFALKMAIKNLKIELG